MVYQKPPMKFNVGTDQYEVDFSQSSPVKEPISEWRSFEYLAIILAIIAVVLAWLFLK